MNDTLIFGVLYIEFHEQLGPNPLYWLPSDISEETRMLLSIKTITILSGEEDNIPKTLIIIPFPSINKKVLIRYIDREDESRRGNMALSAITVLFDDAQDAIFYKYIKELEPIFDEISEKLSNLDVQTADKEAYMIELSNFRAKLNSVLKEFRDSEMKAHGSEAFPETETKSSKNIQYRWKILIIGDPEVGKTSTVLRFTNNAFKRSYIPTIGTNISEKIITLEKERILLVLWDIAGQAKYVKMRAHFYEKAEGVFLVFDLTREKTFKNILNWHKDIKNSITAKHGFTGFMLGNKNDLVDARKVSREDAERVAKELNLKYFETSALTGENVEEAFKTICKTLLDLKKIMQLKRLN